MIVDPRKIELTPEQQAELAALAATTGQPWAEVLSTALSRYRAETSAQADRRPGESLLDVAARLGLVGCVTGSPRDLSTNQQHMEGFGSVPALS